MDSFREDYANFRTGSAKGAHGDPAVPAVMVPNVVEDRDRSRHRSGSAPPRCLPEGFEAALAAEPAELAQSKGAEEEQKDGGVAVAS